MTDIQLESDWKELKQPPSLTRRFEFNSYTEMRQFLEELADLSEKTGLYPNLNFTSSQVNISIQSEGEELEVGDFSFAKKAESLNCLTAS